MFISPSLSVCESVCAHACTRKHATMYMWRMEGNLQELVLSFPYVSPRAQTQVVSLGGKLFTCRAIWSLLFAS